MTPAAPTARAGRVMESSPLRIETLIGQRLAQLAEALDGAARFLDRDNVRMLARRAAAMVSTAISMPLRPGTL